MTHEPYRYAIPESTETKLAKLRVKATGQRRKGGAGKGVKGPAKLPGGSRTSNRWLRSTMPKACPSPRPCGPASSGPSAAPAANRSSPASAAQVVPRATGSSSLLRRKSHAGN